MVIDSFPSGTKVITLLPGSRLQEVKRMLPIFLESLELLKKFSPEFATVVITAPNDDVKTFIEKFVERCSLPVILIPGSSLAEKYNAFNVSHRFLLNYTFLRKRSIFHHAIFLGDW